MTHACPPAAGHSRGQPPTRPHRPGGLAAPCVAVWLAASQSSTAACGCLFDTMSGTKSSFLINPSVVIQRRLYTAFFVPDREESGTDSNSTTTPLPDHGTPASFSCLAEAIPTAARASRLLYGSFLLLVSVEHNVQWCTLTGSGYETGPNASCHFLSCSNLSRRRLFLGSLRARR
ncbi:hypothetical protein B0T24DRAFT_154319 [Lasiosphaeria ovina]|uniref:Uncharacterized protein n=1 Tax=Lasiosphaeria ovina TaxID=92902 RepID=A0AAE0NCZ0_9PEZI|nr:hypothetical protein B0T24DRAFT_154319 [Lasiosphaeria ovina]